MTSYGVCIQVTNYSPQTKMREGNVFTGVCDSVHGGSACSRGMGLWSWGCVWSRGVPVPGVWLGGGIWSRGVPVSGGFLFRRSGPGGGDWWRPPGRLLLQVVRILLECILVCDCLYLLFQFSDRILLWQIWDFQTVRGGGEFGAKTFYLAKVLPKTE